MYCVLVFLRKAELYGGQRRWAPPPWLILLYIFIHGPSFLWIEVKMAGCCKRHCGSGSGSVGILNHVRCWIRIQLLKLLTVHHFFHNLFYYSHEKKADLLKQFKIVEMIQKRRWFENVAFWARKSAVRHCRFCKSSKSVYNEYRDIRTQYDKGKAQANTHRHKLDPSLRWAFCPGALQKHPQFCDPATITNLEKQTSPQLP